MAVAQFLEDYSSLLPALHLLQKLGYQYLTPSEALALRGGKTHIARRAGQQCDRVRIAGRVSQDLCSGWLRATRYAPCSIKRCQNRQR